MRRAAVVEAPAVRDGQARGVAVAEVVVVRVALGGEVLEPHEGAPVLVLQGGRRGRGAAGSRALASHPGHRTEHPPVSGGYNMFRRVSRRSLTVQNHWSPR